MRGREAEAEAEAEGEGEWELEGNCIGEGMGGSESEGK